MLSVSVGEVTENHSPLCTLCWYQSILIILGVTLPVPLWAVHNYTIDILRHSWFSLYCMSFYTPLQSSISQYKSYPLLRYPNSPNPQNKNGPMESKSHKPHKPFLNFIVSNRRVTVPPKPLKAPAISKAYASDSHLRTG